MPRYFLHLHECGTVTVDEEGHQLADLDEARRVAAVSARDVMCGEIHAGRLCLDCVIVIEDDRGEVARVPFREAIALSGS